MPLTITPVGATEVFARYWSQANLWFTTSTVQKPGAFDNVADADNLCDTLAANAGLIERDYRAWLSTSTDSAIQRLNQLSVGPQPNGWSRVDNKRFADGQLALTQGKILFPPRLDEFGRDVGDEDQVVAHRMAGGELAQPQRAFGEHRRAVGQHEALRRAAAAGDDLLRAHHPDRAVHRHARRSLIGPW